MFEFLKNKSAEPRQVHDTEEHFDSTQLAEPSRLEVADAVLKDVLRKHTIPGAWVSCEVREIPMGPGRTQVQIQLVINRWSEQLMRYTGALQQQFVDALDNFEPHIDHTTYMVVWRFSDSCSMPFHTIPDNVKWHVSAVNADSTSSA